MIRYEFECVECHAIYDVWSSAKDKKKNVNKAKCPNCSSKKKQENFGVAFKFGNPIGTDKWGSDSTGHDFRHKWNMMRKGGVIDQRKHAEEKSHVGPTPYREIDDLNKDSSWGKVK